MNALEVRYVKTLAKIVVIKGPDIQGAHWLSKGYLATDELG